jgi:hypothetical protein
LLGVGEERITFAPLVRKIVDALIK